MAGDKTVSDFHKALKTAQSVLFITGAGISADSGLPTYRGIGGLYEGELTEEGIPIETVLAGETLRTRPELTWKYLAQIERNCRGARPNRAHQTIAALEKRFDRLVVLTQNIDGLHRAAGTRNLIEIHGNLHDIICPACGWERSIRDFDDIAIPPRCEACQGLARPKVVFFGEMLPEDAIERYYDEMELGFDVYVWIGTTAVFPYISAPVHAARNLGKLTVEINPAESEVSRYVDIHIRRGAADVMGEVGEGLGVL